MINKGMHYKDLILEAMEIGNIKYLKSIDIHVPAEGPVEVVFKSLIKDKDFKKVIEGLKK